MFRKLRKAMVELVGRLRNSKAEEPCSEWENILRAVRLGFLANAITRPTVVCLCGSGRFREAFETAEFDETLQGKIVLTIGCNTHDIARSAQLAPMKPMLDTLHLRKIDLADEVLILNVGGYIGESTGRELDYARRAGKTIRFLESTPRKESITEGPTP